MVAISWVPSPNGGMAVSVTSEREQREPGQEERSCLPEVCALPGRCFLCSQEVKASGSSGSRKGRTCPANSTFFWQEMKGKCVQNKREEFLERERTKKKKNKNKKQLSLEFFHLGQAIWRGCDRHPPSPHLLRLCLSSRPVSAPSQL